MPAHRGHSDGILAGPIDIDAPRRRQAFRAVPGNPGVVFTHRDSGFRGEVAGRTADTVRLRDHNGRTCDFRLVAGAFTLDGEKVAIAPATVRVTAKKAGGPTHTASGSIASTDTRAKVARGSRIWVEGIHDAELVEKVWGDDLRAEGVVVEQLEGADDLAAHVRAFQPTDDRRLGVLLDHLVAGTKERRIASEVKDRHVMIRGHEFIDIWQAVKPATIGLDAWPVIPKGTPWKEGICRELGWTGTTGEFWKKLLRSVKTYRDLDPSLLAAVEELIDFVAPPPTDD